MSSRLERARLLLNQSRHDLAERELRGVLGSDPDNADAHSLLGWALAGQGRETEALGEARAAIGLRPDGYYGYCVLADILLDFDRPREAEAATAEAERLEPDLVSLHGLRSRIALRRRRWAEALERAERGLQLGPEDVCCLNCRAAALLRLNRPGELDAAMKAVLAVHPENAFSYAIRGWALLQTGKPGEAMASFREALRQNPGQAWALSGVAEASKAGVPVYRQALRLMLKLATMERKRRLAAVAAGALIVIGLMEISEHVPGANYAFWPAAVLFFGFALLVSPFSNLLLRLNRTGSRALTKDQIAAANWTGVCVLGIAVGLGLYWVAGRDGGLMIAVFGVAMVLPVIVLFRSRPGLERRILGMVTIGLAVLSVLGAILALVGKPWPVFWSVAAGCLGVEVYNVIRRRMRIG